MIKWWFYKNILIISPFLSFQTSYGPTMAVFLLQYVTNMVIQIGKSIARPEGLWGPCRPDVATKINALSLYRAHFLATQARVLTNTSKFTMPVGILLGLGHTYAWEIPNKAKGSGTYNHSCLNEFLTVVSKAQNKPQWPEFPNFVHKLWGLFF